MQIDKRLVVQAGRKDFFHLSNEYDIWERCLLKQDKPEYYAYVDAETTKKIRDIQHETQSKIEALIKKNLDKLVGMTEADIKNYKVK